MFVIPYTAPNYLFGKKFLASFEAYENISSINNAIFSGVVDFGEFNIGDTVYIMNSNYKVLGYGKITVMLSYENSLNTAKSGTFLSSLEIETGISDINEPIFIIKPDKNHMQDLFIIKTQDCDVFFVDYAFDFKTAICKYINANFETSEVALEETWNKLSANKVKQIISNLNAEGKDEMITDDGLVELIYIPEKSAS